MADETQLDKAQPTSLAQRLGLGNGRKRFLLCDVSGSMDSGVGGEEPRRKIDALRDLVASLRIEHGIEFKQITFGGEVELREDIPEPNGSTPMAKALDMAREYGAKRVVIVSDGAPDNEDDARKSAIDLACQIDVYYVGPPGERGEKFLAELAALAGGRFATRDLGAGAKMLTQEVERSLLALPPAIELGEST